MIIIWWIPKQLSPTQELDYYQKHEYASVTLPVPLLCLPWEVIIQYVVFIIPLPLKSAMQLEIYVCLNYAFFHCTGIWTQGLVPANQAL
jgi:hypothetical protein